MLEKDQKLPFRDRPLFSWLD